MADDLATDFSGLAVAEKPTTIDDLTVDFSNLTNPILTNKPGLVITYELKKFPFYDNVAGQSFFKRYEYITFFNDNIKYISCEYELYQAFPTVYSSAEFNKYVWKKQDALNAFKHGFTGKSNYASQINLVEDPYGEKKLYLYNMGNLFHFASSNNNVKDPLPDWAKRIFINEFIRLYGEYCIRPDGSEYYAFY